MRDLGRKYPDIQIVNSQVSTLVPASDAYPRNMGADMIRLNDGRLFLAYSQWFGGTHDDNSSRVVGCISRDDGETWSDFFVIAEPNETRDVVRMPTFLRLQDGRLALFARCHHTRDKKWVVMMVCDDESGDVLDASVWSAPTSVTPEGPGGHIIIAQRVIRTTPGRIVVPTAAPYPWDLQQGRKTADIRSSCMLSDDDGKTWRVSSTLTDGPLRGMMEPCVIELRDGRLMMLIRTQAHFQYVSYSNDGGDVWTPAVEMPDLVSPESPAALAHVPDSNVMMVVWNHNKNEGSHGENRRPLTVGFSNDGGQSWGSFQNIEMEPHKSWSYPSIRFIDGKAWVFYYERVETPESNGHISLKVNRFEISI